MPIARELGFAGRKAVRRRRMTSSRRPPTRAVSDHADLPLRQIGIVEIGGLVSTASAPTSTSVSTATTSARRARIGPGGDGVLLDPSAGHQQRKKKAEQGNPQFVQGKAPVEQRAALAQMPGQLGAIDSFNRSGG